jgi:uncharacterized protein with GYD domain
LQNASLSCPRYQQQAGGQRHAVLFDGGLYTPGAERDEENPNTNRQAAVEQLLSAAGGKLVSMYGRASNGPGVMLIFDVTDPAMAPAMTGVAVSAGTIQNVELTRLFTMDEIAGIRQKARQIQGAYKPPGQQ